jgi:RimJ/RimL family protein N-acetyltransferase
MAIDDGKDLLGVVVFHNYQPPATIEISIITVSNKWCTKSVLLSCFDYCFNIAKVKRIYTQVCASNHVAINMNKRLGFTELAVLPDFVVKTTGEVTDNHVFTMTKNECKWLWVDKVKVQKRAQA